MSLIESLLQDPALITQIGLVQENYKQGNKSYRKTAAPDRPSPRIYIFGDNCRLQLNNRSQYPNDITFQIVKWSIGDITLFESPNDALSFDFSGCVMARFLWKGKWYAAHIHNADKKDANLDQRLAWGQFVRDQSITNIVMFQPGTNLLPITANDREIWGVITANQQCYTIDVKDATTHSSNVTYTLNQILQHPGMGQDMTYYDPILRCPDNTPYDQVSRIWNSFWARQSSPVQVPVYSTKSRCRI